MELELGVYAPWITPPVNGVDPHCLQTEMCVLVEAERGIPRVFTLHLLLAPLGPSVDRGSKERLAAGEKSDPSEFRFCTALVSETRWKTE
jgi:hypothetical protein